MKSNSGALTIALVFSLAAATWSVRAATPNATDGDDLSSGRVPVTVLIDNDKVRVQVMTLPTGYVRTQDFIRRSDQFLVYIDPGTLVGYGSHPVLEARYAAHQGKPVVCGDITEDCGPVDPSGILPVGGVHPAGSVSWRPKGGPGAAIRVLEGCRVLYIELKHGKATAPDPLAARLSYEATPSGGAPARIQMDNPMFRVSLVSFPAGFTRAGDLKRRYDTVVAYIDDGALEDVGPPQMRYAAVTARNHPDGPAKCDRILDCDSVGPDGRWANAPVKVKGTVAWHPKDGYVESTRVARAHREVYIELKE